MEDVTEAIIRKASQGDVDAFEVIYRQYSRFVYNVALRVVRTQEAAEEVVQEVFISVFRKLKDFRFRASLKTWVYRITVNTALNMARKWSKEQKQMSEYQDQITAAEIYPGPVAELDKEDAEKTVVALLGHLNPEQRACLVLRSIEGLSYQEIAETLKININTVRSRLKRAREALLALRKEVSQNEL